MDFFQLDCLPQLDFFSIGLFSAVWTQGVHHDDIQSHSPQTHLPFSLSLSLSLFLSVCVCKATRDRRVLITGFAGAAGPADVTVDIQGTPGTVTSLTVSENGHVITATTPGLPRTQTPNPKP